MVLRGFLFTLLTFGITFAVAFLVAAIMKLIAVVVKRERGASGGASK